MGVAILEFCKISTVDSIVVNRNVSSFSVSSLIFSIRIINMATVGLNAASVHLILQHISQQPC